MSERTPDAGPHTIDTLGAKLDALSEDVDKRFDAVNQRFDVVDKRFDAVDKRFDGVERRLDKVEIAVEEIRDSVKQIAEGHAATQALIDRRFHEVIEHLDRRTVPLEAAVRHHSAVLQHHNLTAGSSDAG